METEQTAWVLVLALTLNSFCDLGFDDFSFPHLFLLSLLLAFKKDPVGRASPMTESISTLALCPPGCSPMLRSHVHDSPFTLALGKP